MQNIRFRDLPIGAQFDFVAPGSLRNSFYQRCEKISPRKYRYPNNAAQPVSCLIGTVKTRVYNVTLPTV